MTCYSFSIAHHRKADSFRVVRIYLLPPTLAFEIQDLITQRTSTKTIPHFHPTLTPHPCYATPALTRGRHRMPRQWRSATSARSTEAAHMIPGVSIFYPQPPSIRLAWTTPRSPHIFSDGGAPWQNPRPLSSRPMTMR